MWGTATHANFLIPRVESQILLFAKVERASSAAHVQVPVQPGACVRYVAVTEMMGVPVKFRALARGACNSVIVRKNLPEHRV